MTNRDVQVLSWPCRLISSPHEPQETSRALSLVLGPLSQLPRGSLDTGEQARIVAHLVPGLSLPVLPKKWLFGFSQKVRQFCGEPTNAGAGGGMDQKNTDSRMGLSEGAGAARVPPGDSCRLPAPHLVTSASRDTRELQRFLLNDSSGPSVLGY